MDVAGSAIAVVSIAIQLADGVKKLSDFWKSIEQAPSDVRTIMTDLDLLNQALTGIVLEGHRGNFNAAQERTLRECEVNIQTLCSILNQLEPGFASAKRRVRKFTAFISAMKMNKVKQFMTILDRLKITMMLSLQSLQIQTSHNQLLESRKILLAIERLEDLATPRSEIIPRTTAFETVLVADTMEIPRSQSLSQTNQPCSISESSYPSPDRKLLEADHPSLKVGRSRIKSILWKENWRLELFCGNIEARTVYKSSRLTMQDKRLNLYGKEAQSETETSIKVRPANWLSILGFKTSLHLDSTRSSIKGWKYTFSSTRAVPCDAPIFELCRAGDLPAVQHLLSTGEASVKDTCPEGFQPLHFAAEHLHSELCRFLIKEAGADLSAEVDLPNYRYYRTPATQACDWVRSYHGIREDSESIMDILRLLLDSFDFSDPSKTGWQLLRSLAEGSGGKRITHCGPQEVSAIFQWLIVQVWQEMKIDFIREEYDKILSWLNGATASGALPLWLKVGPKGAIETLFDDGTNILRERVRIAPYHLDEEPAISIIEALVCGADPNSVGLAISKSPKEESPTSLSMYTNFGFGTWLIALREAKIDANNVFDIEISRGSLHDEDWTRETFERLVEWETSCQMPPVAERCRICAQHFEFDSAVIVQPRWVYALEEIKNGRCPSDTIYALPRNVDALSDSKPDLGSASDVSQELDQSGDRKFEAQDGTEAIQAIENNSSEWDTDIFLTFHKRFRRGRNSLLASSEDSPRLEADMENEFDAVAIEFDLDTWSWLEDEDTVCMNCWIELLGIKPEETLYQPFTLIFDDEYSSGDNSDANTDADTDASSEHEFSPFLFHP